MPYSTPAMVRQALAPSTDGSLPDEPTDTAADLTDTQLTDAINEADATIDAYIGGYYNVPVALANNLAPHPIDYWSRNIAAYNATLAYRGSMDFADTDPVARRYKDTLAALQAVSTGRLHLQVTDNTGAEAATGAGSVLNPYVGDLWTPDDFFIGPDSEASGQRWGW